MSMRYAPVIRTCEICKKKSKDVQARVLLEVKTLIVSSVYLNNWTNLCNECKSNLAQSIENSLNAPFGE